MEILYIVDNGWIPGITRPSDAKAQADIQMLFFGPGRPLCLGEGGALLCRRAELYHWCVSLSQHPERVIAEGGTPFDRPPVNARIYPLAAVIGASLLRPGIGEVC